MTKALIQTYTIAHEYRRTITTALMAACMVCGLLYAMNMYRTISHSIAIQNMTREMAAADASVQDLDKDYVSLSSDITPDILRKYGFDKAEVSAFISRTASLGFAQAEYGL